MGVTGIVRQVSNTVLDSWALYTTQLAEEFPSEGCFHATGIAATMAESFDEGKLHTEDFTCNGESVQKKVIDKHTWNPKIIRE